MKTAKEWRIEVQDNDCASYGGSLDRFIRAIQLDAMKEGARRAAEVCVQYKNYGDLHPPINTRNAILALVENLTLSDL